MGVRERSSTEHRYQLCNDPLCDRFICRVYQEGRRDGYQEGHQRGWDEGYGTGFQAGLASCPGPHGGSA
jgi:hypothetical protein